MLSIILTLLNRKKQTLFWSFLGVALCNGVFFFSSCHKMQLLGEYTSMLPRFSEKDIYIVSNESSDVLHPKAFAFPHGEKVARHEDVLGVSPLAMVGDEFVRAEENPELLVVSLKKDANVQKWMDTFKTKNEYVAIHSGQYKYMYNKAIIVRNRALHAHFSLLAMISITSFIFAGVFAASSAFKLCRELRILLLEGMGKGKVLFGFWFCLSKLSGFATFMVFCVSACFINDIYLLIQLLVKLAVVQTLALFLAMSGIVLFSKGSYGKNRI